MITQQHYDMAHANVGSDTLYVKLQHLTVDELAAWYANEEHKREVRRLKAKQKVKSSNMKYCRTIVTIANTGEIIYGKFSEFTDDQLTNAKEIYENIDKINYISIESETGDFTYIKGDAIAHIKLEKSQR